ncbi:outer membrane beta-barrel protein [Pedobacter insulae]|uniref:Outer membrane receptor proteins, mostly Fe transport n=1 Tax=Pedobacter insulae TaxID=414048 RepID=A0A1I2T5V6_9SPHI|nr:outer membrane beta-barrel protein [Pedobacter insulae]SFG60323.1 Outer membrane receptor proteins, mostly Fe transport [Pedobacter insulae]
MKKLVPIFLALTFLSLITLNVAAFAGKGIIHGKVVEEVGGLVVPFAGVALYESGAEQALFTTQTDENGDFKFINLKPGSYKVKISSVGFSILFISEILLTEKDFEKNLGTIKLSSEASTLTEVVITAQKPVVEFGADIITYNVGSSILAEGSTATDVLKNVPMVQVDIDGNATISGKRSTRVFIDGKPSEYMTSNIADLLNVLPSDAIEKIEVMTNPPSKYSGDGEGILNIVLKKGFRVGFNGNVGVTAGLQGNTNTNVNASYKGKDYSVNGGGAYGQNVGKSDGEVYRKNIFADTTFYNNQFNNNRNENERNFVRLGLNWDITPKQNLRLSTNYNKSDNENRSGNDFHYINEALEEVRLRNQQNLGAGNSNNFVINADYNLQTDTSGGKLSMGLTFNTNSNNNYRTFNRRYAFPTNLNPTLQQNSNETENNGLTFNLDYDKPLFKKRDRFEFGLAYNYRKNDNDLLVENFNFTSQQYITDDKLTNRFFYNENILGAYTAYNYRKNGWGAKTGIRAELTDVKFDLSTGERYHVSPYLSLFPNISLNRFFRKRYNFGATYSVRINRPRENALNPQVNNADSLNISYGNPDLTPAYTHQMDLSFGAFGNKWSFTPRISYSRSMGVIERYRTVNQSGVSESTFKNVGANTAFSLMLNGNYRPTQKITTNASFSVFQTKYTSQLNTSLNRDGFSLRAVLGLSMQLPYKTAFESNVNYANRLNAQGRSRGSVNSSFGARKNFFKNTLSVRVSTNDPFGRRNNIIFNQGNNFISESYSTNNSSNVSLSLSYRFSKIKSTKPTAPAPPKI